MTKVALNPNPMVKRPARGSRTVVNTKHRAIMSAKGQELTRQSLLKDVPPRQTPEGQSLRWTANRKSDVLTAVKHNLITEAERDLWYAFTTEEWARDAELLKNHGLFGLKSKTIQDIRRDE